MSKNPVQAVDDDDEGEPERLTSKEFVDLIPHLSFSQILQVEIFMYNSWKPLVKEDKSNNSAGTKTYWCSVCRVSQSMKNMVAHIAGKRHANIMQTMKEIYHPEYTYPKSKQTVKVSNAETKQTNPKQNVPEIESEATYTSKNKNLVVNPLTLNRSKEAVASPKKTTKEPASNAEKPPSNIDDSEIPEIIIIDDYDEEQSSKNSEKTSPTQKEPEPEPQLEPEKKKPKIMVSSFAKCIESSDDDANTSNKSKEDDKKKKTSPEKTKSSADEDKNKIHGFIGVEYVVKICGDNTPTRYECGLCELSLGFDDMQKHLLGYSHRLKFCEKHFPTAIQQFRQYIVDVPSDEHYKVMIPVLQKLAEAIEKHHGRAQPYECNLNRFKQERIRVLTEVFARSHASEQDGPTFTHVINSKDVDQFISKRNSSSHQEKMVTTPIFDVIKPSTSKFATAPASSSSKGISVLKRNTRIDNKPIVKMASAMRMHFQMSQPYHVDGLLGAQPYVEPQPYLGQQPYMHQPPQFIEQPPFAPPQHFMGPQPVFNNRQQTVDDETHKRMVDKFLRANSKDAHQNSASRSHRRDNRHERHDRHDRQDRNAHHRDSERSSRRSRSPPPRPRSPSRSSASAHSTSSKVQHSPDIWRSYCRLVDHKLNALNERFQAYKANPESHPSYNEEWLKFWHRRKAELIAMGKDYRTYDYQPDWVLFFNNRIKELYEEAFEELKIQSREELSLPFTNDFVLETKYYVQRAKPTAAETKKKENPIEPPAMADLVPPSETSNINAMNTHETRPAETVENIFEKQSSRPAGVSIRIEDDETPTFVSVLRLLTALEEHLGSLGPKIVDLLTKALQAEKSSPDRGLALINEENCTLLETAMEKFKGLVIANIVDSAKERALKKAITKVTLFLEVAKKTRELVAKRTTSSLQSTTNEEMPKKQQAIEEKIAALLAAQGQTNFDPEKLEQLAKVCILLDKKKREASAASTSRSQPTAQKPLSDALSDIMGNFGSAGVTARKPAADTYAVSGHGGQRSTTSAANNQYQPAPSSSSSSTNYANGNPMNTHRNFGSTYSHNVSDFVPHNNRNTEPPPMTAWQNEQQQYHAHNYMQPNTWGQDANQAWEAANQHHVSYPAQPNRPPMRRGPYM